MGDLLLTEEQWDERRLDCPCLDSLNNQCDARRTQINSNTFCYYEKCPFVFWLNAINIEK